MLHKILYKKKVLHLADHSKAKRVNLGLKTLREFLKVNNYVPGFADIVVVTSAKKVKEFKDEASKWPEPLWLLTPDKLTSEWEPDVLWIDDVNLLIEEVGRVVKKFQHIKGCHIIFSGKKNKSAKMRLMVDTREQKPLWKGHECKRMKLDCGDYTTEKLLDRFHIERKSLEDLYGTILGGHIRFRKEHLRSCANNTTLALYVEGSKKDFAAKNFRNGHKRACSGATLIKIIDSIESRWPLEVVWCGTRPKAKKMVYQRLQKEERLLK